MARRRGHRPRSIGHWLRPRRTGVTPDEEEFLAAARAYLDNGWFGGGSEQPKQGRRS